MAWGWVLLDDSVEAELKGPPQAVGGFQTELVLLDDSVEAELKEQWVTHFFPFFGRFSSTTASRPN